MHGTVKIEEFQEVEAGKIKQNKTRMLGGGSDIDWYTPDWVLDAVRKALGAPEDKSGRRRGRDLGIDLDPASSEEAQKRVKAGRFCTPEGLFELVDGRYSLTAKTDGKSLQWSGRVFCNPPYSMPEVSLFARKMADSWHNKCITAGIILTNNSTDTEWFHYMWRYASAVCLTRGRIAFYEGWTGNINRKMTQTHGQAFVYFGKNPKRFASHFSAFGGVCYGTFMHARKRIDNKE